MIAIEKVALSKGTRLLININAFRNYVEFIDRSIVLKWVRKCTIESIVDCNKEALLDQGAKHFIDYNAFRSYINCTDMLDEIKLSFLNGNGHF